MSRSSSACRGRENALPNLSTCEPRIVFVTVQPATSLIIHAARRAHIDASCCIALLVGRSERSAMETLKKELIHSPLTHDGTHCDKVDDVIR